MFNKGDHVVCVDVSGVNRCLAQGRTYVVTEDLQESEYIGVGPLDDGRPSGKFYRHRFQLTAASMSGAEEYEEIMAAQEIMSNE